MTQIIVYIYRKTVGTFTFTHTGKYTYYSIIDTYVYIYIKFAGRFERVGPTPNTTTDDCVNKHSYGYSNKTKNNNIITY